MTLHYTFQELHPYINWIYFYHAWQLRQPEQQQNLRREAEQFLADVAERYRAHAIFLIVPAHSDGDDIVIEGNAFTLPMLRQQTGQPPYLCLSDFIAPSHDSGLCVANSQRSMVNGHIGIFATSVDQGMEHDFDHDPYQKMMAQLLADRLAEAAAERMHEEVRKHYWGYAPDEYLSIEEMQQEHFQGIRPAVGYPSLPDASLNFLLDRLLDFSRIGISLTESGAMRPHASVSGLMLAHPEAHYFSVGVIGPDQLADYARRRGLTLDKARQFLSSNLPLLNS